jgi:hypothetical protein
MKQLRRDLSQGMLVMFGAKYFLFQFVSKNIKIKRHKTVGLILPVVLHGCGTWSVTLREVSRLRVFENMVLRRIFGAKRDKVTREWRKLHNGELYDVYSSPNIIRVRMR